jgi:hypothetical protein
LMIEMMMKVVMLNEMSFVFLCGASALRPRAFDLKFLVAL